MHAATRPPMPGMMGMVPQANGPGPGPNPGFQGDAMQQRPYLPPPGPMGFNNHPQQPGVGMPQPYSATNGSHGPQGPGQPGLMPVKPGPGLMPQQPLGPGPGPARPPSSNGVPFSQHQPMPGPYGGPPAPTSLPGPANNLPPRPSSSQGMNPPLPSAPTSNAGPYGPPQSMGPGPKQPGMAPGPYGQPPSSAQAPGGAPMPGMGGPPQTTFASGPRMTSQPYPAGPGMGPSPTIVPLPTSGMGYPAPPRPGLPPGPGQAYQPGPPHQPTAGPPRPGFPPAPTPGTFQPLPGGPPSGPTGLAGPPSGPTGLAGPPSGPTGLSGPPRPGMPGQYPTGPSMPGQFPPSQGMPGMPVQPGGGYPTQMNAGMGGPMGGPMSGPMGGAGRRSLDPDQMPSPIHVMEEDQKNNGGEFQTKDKGQVPPLVTTQFVVQDYGNASPRFIRSTMYTVPATEELRKQSGVPFALVLTPMAKVAEGEVEPPVTDFGPSGPVRCIRCHAYMSPFMQFIDGGRRFQCAFCKATTEVPADYFQHLDHTGMRLDRYQRPELCLGTYEIVATKDYCRDSKEPNTPGILFAIDVSYPMVKEGVVQLICANIKSMLADLPSDPYCDKDRMRVGFMTYDNKINFYNIKGNLSQPQQLTVGDVDDMFVPLVDGLMCSVAESESVIDSLLEQIPLMYAETRETETILAPVIQAGKEAFKAANCAGKLVIFHHNLPVAEAPGKLKNRDDRKLLGTDKEKSVLAPQCKDYNTLGQDCVGVGCSVDMFLFNNAYIDVSTISQVCRLSGGQLYKYTYFQPDIDGDRFLADLRHDLSRPVVFDAIMRVRTSTGVRPVDFFGNFYMANTTDTELASLNSDMAIACEIKYDDKLTEEDGVYIQAALLFTSCSGQRRLRVINLSLNTSGSMSDMYRSCELDTIINFQAKQAISKLMESNPKTVKEWLIANCAQILACYRKNCASPSSAGQLILPECMKLLPLYTNCLLKSDALCGGADLGCDDRAFLMHSLGSMDVASTVAYFYPRLIPLHDLPHEEDEDRVTMPHPLRCSIEKVTDDGVYIMENGFFMFFYVGLAANPTWINDVFGVQTAAQINVEKPKLEDRDNPMSKQVRKIVSLILKERQRHHMKLVIVRQREKLDTLFRHFLCEDRGTPGSGAGDFNFSYVDFLCHMHKEIRALLG